MRAQNTASAEPAARLPRSPTPLDRLAATSPARYEEVDWAPPIDLTRWFVCETQTPLYYTPVYGQLDEPQRRRYNQLTGMLSNELIALLETDLLAAALRALLRKTPGADLIAAIRRFQADERRHAETWRRLNRLSEPRWYTTRDRHFVRLPGAVFTAARLLASRPAAFPVVLFVQLAQEERAVDMARRCLVLPPGRLEPRYAAVHRAHLHDEVRHVQVDWHLIERFYDRRSRAVRQMTAALFRLFVGSVLLTPVYSTARVLDALAAEFPELRPLVPRMLRKLGALAHDDAYHEMMYSRTTTPITFALFDRFEEFHQVRAVLRAYQPR